MMGFQIKDWGLLYENNRTRGMKRMLWVPVPNKLDGEGYTELVSHPSGAAHLGAWLVILQVASRCDPRGALVRGNGQPHTSESLARMSRLPSQVFDEAIPRLLSIGWLEAIPQDGAEIPQDGAGSTHPTDYEGRKEGREGTEENENADDDWLYDYAVENTVPPLCQTDPTFSSSRARALTLRYCELRDRHFIAEYARVWWDARTQNEQETALNL